MELKSIWATVLGIVGFIGGAYLLFYHFGKGESNFHEIKADPTAIARVLLEEKRSIVSQQNSFLSKEMTALEDRKACEPEDCKRNAITTELDRVKAKHTADTALESGIDYYFSNNQDSIDKEKAQRSIHSDLDFSRLDTLDNTYMREAFDSFTVNFNFDDHALTGEESSKAISLKLQPFRDDIDLFTRYPGFGIWALLVIVFCSALFVGTFFCISTGQDLMTHTKEKICKGSVNYWTSCGICFILMVLFAITIDRTFYDDFVIKDYFFMNGFSWRMKVLILSGYLGAVFCFAGMMSTGTIAACYVRELAANANTSKLGQLREEVASLKAALNALPADAAGRAAIEKELEDKKTALAVVEDELAPLIRNYRHVRNLFSYFFYTIAALLALLVFCTGSLYTAMDSLDFIRMIRDDSGYSPVRHDFVYLYGGVHTVLILFFYLPAQMQLKSEKMLLPDESGTEDSGGKKFLSSLQGQMKNLGQALVVGAPLLASFAQWLIDNIFNP